MNFKLKIILPFILMAFSGFGQNLPKGTPPFNGKIETTYKTSKPDFPQPITPPAGAPNVLLILIDDLGFGGTEPFGGLIPTPNIDRLAQKGLLYNRFHTTALCSPTRAALLTGRNHHQSGNAGITEGSTGYPGYDSYWGLDNAAIPEILKDNGYNTAAFGKWHNTPDWETSPLGPFDRWPTGKGFERFYGFIGGETNQYYPQLYQNIQPIEKGITEDPNYLFTPDMTNEAISWLGNQNSISADKPWFMYFAPGAMHIRFEPTLLSPCFR
ncbi:sulfatase-like hydrolase/transferase [Flavobacterium plurextorum]|uniref:sulfatase-like hydrolase/transferase n=1 Tax=Flavobacterium TaxID=237 RepID=UPI00214D58D3|nr:MULTISPECIES: sulfatase-like hydrolase/transferase [Flavobacterium]UUW08682.1 sulfatase-like hydrolase/transferase [Flavobacterium plurextorum]